MGFYFISFYFILFYFILFYFLCFCFNHRSVPLGSTTSWSHHTIKSQPYPWREDAQKESVTTCRMWKMVFPPHLHLAGSFPEHPAHQFSSKSHCLLPPLAKSDAPFGFSPAKLSSQNPLCQVQVPNHCLYLCPEFFLNHFSKCRWLYIIFFRKPSLVQDLFVLVTLV